MGKNTWKTGDKEGRNEEEKERIQRGPESKGRKAGMRRGSRKGGCYVCEEGRQQEMCKEGRVQKLSKKMKIKQEWE